MPRIRVTLLAAVAASALAVAGVAQAKQAKTTLKGTVGPGFTITLTDAAGKKVKKLKPGVYVFLISDKSDIHNFHLKGPGADKDSGVKAKGNFAWTLTLKQGTYTFVCDPHAPIMKGSFTVA